MTQNEALLGELRKRGNHGITALEALTEIGTLRLAARVHELRKAGHKIVSYPFRTKSGDKKKVALYILETE
jgi:hypothetical protein